MKFTSTSRKIYDLEANVTDMNMAKNRQNLKKNNTQLKNLLLMIKKLQSKHIF